MHCGEDEQARGEGAHVPAIFLAQTRDSIEALLELLRGIHVGDPAVGIPGCALHRRFLAPRHPNRRGWLLYGGGLARPPPKPGELTREGDVLLRPPLGDHLQRLVCPSAALIHWYSAGLELCGKLATDTDTKVIASARRHVERRPHLGYNHRLVEWQQHHRAEQLDAPGRPGCHRQ